MIIPGPRQGGREEETLGEQVRLLDLPTGRFLDLFFVSTADYEMSESSSA